MSQKNSIAFWDFDDTLTKGDSLWYFLAYTQPWSRLFFAAARFSPILLGMKLGWISNLEAKIRVFRYFFDGWESKKFLAFCEGFAQEKIPGMLNPIAMKKFEWHKSEGHKVVLVSASLRHYLEPWCQKMGIDCLATELKIVNERVFGEYAQPNCHGPEKARRINEAYDLAQYDKIYAYGNSSGDKEMLKLAHEAFYQTF